MPVIRNPFRKHAPPPTFQSASSTTVDIEPLDSNSSSSGVGRSNDASKSTSAITIVGSTDDEKNSYKMSVVNDSGVYLPPSPPEKKSFWRREHSSSSNGNRPPMVPPNEQFTISRESFDSYRRSFDISARSPVSDTAPARASFDARPFRERASLDVGPSTGSRMSVDVRPRMSLDSRPARPSLDQRSPRTPTAAKVVEELDDDEFEEIALSDPHPKKLGLFSRFGGDHGSKEPSKDGGFVRPKSGLFGRKDHSHEVGHESELKRIDQDRTQ